MKILFATGIYPPDIGGPATYTRTMARALQERGHEVCVICYSDKEYLDFEKEHSENFEVIRISRMQSRRARYEEYEEKAFQKAKEMDLVYLQGPVSEGVPGSRAAKRAGKPYVLKVVGDYAWEVYQGSGGKELLDDFIKHRHWLMPKIRMIEKYERDVAQGAKKIITPSKYLKDIVTKWGIEEKIIEVIYNASQPFPDGMARDEARKRFGLDGKRVMFTAVRAVPWKSIDFIIRLLPKLGADVILCVAGDGPCLTDWKKEAETKKVKDRVIFLGKLDRKTMGEWYRAADLFVLPSGYEGYPNVFAEALTQGLPSFLSDKGGNVEAHSLLMNGNEEKMEKISLTTFVQNFSYLDEEKWLNALKAPWPQRCDDISFFADSVMTFNMMFDKTINILETFSTPRHFDTPISRL